MVRKSKNVSVVTYGKYGHEKIFEDPNLGGRKLEWCWTCSKRKQV